MFFTEEQRRGVKFEKKGVLRLRELDFLVEIDAALEARSSTVHVLNFVEVECLSW